MRLIRTMGALVAAVALSAGLAACSTGPDIQGAPTSGTVSISIENPRYVEGADDCGESPAVADAFMSADMPTSHISYTLVEDVDAAGVTAIIDCLRVALASGTVSFE